MIAGLAFRNVLRNKERSLLTLVGVVLAIGSFVALVSIATGFTSRVERELGSREVHIYITASRASTLPVSPLAAAGGAGVSLPRELLPKLELEGVRSVTPVIRSSLDGPRSVIPVLAIPFEQVEIVFKGGRFKPSPRELAPIEAPLPDDELEPETQPEPETSPEPSPSATPPETVEPEPSLEDGLESSETEKTTKLYPVLVGQGLQRDIKELEKAGNLVIEDSLFARGADMGSLGFLDYSVIAPIEAFFEKRPDRGVHEYWISVQDENQVGPIQKALKEKINEFIQQSEESGTYTGARNIKVLTRNQYTRSAKEYLGYGWMLQVSVAMVGVLIAVTASMNTMLMSTYERLGEYATLRAVGASRRVISMTIIYEAIFLNVTGGLLGLAFGTLATGVLDKAVALLLEIPYPMAGITPALLLQALMLSFGVGIIGAIIPCFIVSRIDLVAELRKGL